MSFKEIIKTYKDIKETYALNNDYGVLQEFKESSVEIIALLPIYMSPRYSISYSLSQISAFNIFEISLTNQQKAWDLYEKLCSLGGKYDYQETLLKIGLEPAYQTGNVKKIVAFAEKYLKLIV